MGICSSTVSPETRKKNLLLAARFALPLQILIRANDVSDDRMKEYLTLFNKLDEKKKRSIDVSHVEGALKTLGMGVDVTALNNLLANAGVENGDLINFDFFVKIILGYIRRSDPEVEMRKAFQVFDHDKDGLIDADEIRTTMKWNDKAIAKFIRRADKNNDGLIDYNEFIRLLVGGEGTDIDFN